MPGQYFGKYTGIVKDNRDADKNGHLQVVVPAIFPPDELVVARAALPYGFFFVPAAEAKVWIEFEGGDPDLPLWTGVQYVQGEWAPEAANDPPEKRVVKSVAGHLVILDDTSGQESIEIKEGKKGHSIKLDKDGLKLKDGVSGHEVAFDATTIVIKHGKSGAKIELGSAGITIDGAAGPINLSASASMPVLRANMDQGIGNLGAPVPLIGPGNPLVKA